MIKSIFIKALWQILAIVVIAACLGLGYNAFRGNRVPLACQWSDQAMGATVSEATPTISIEEAALMFKNNKAVFLDARPASSYAEGHIQGALNLPWQEAEEKCIEVVEKIPEGMTIITYCDGANCDLCDKLAVFLCDMGLEHVSALINGWTAWNQHHLPVDKGNVL